MNTKVLIAALAGAVATFLSGWVIYGMAMKGFYDSNTAEAARGLMRGDNMILWAIFVGCLSWSLLLALIFSRWAGINTFQGGAIGGAWVGFLIALGTNFFGYGSMDIMSMNAAIVDAFVNAVQGAIAGGVVGFVLGYGQAK